MATGYQIRYLQHKEVDRIRWDACITNASNALIYPYSFYLDCMAKHWDALVLDDYLAIMPLTWNKKYGFHYLYQPAFTASLGVFGKNLTNGMIDDFIKSIPSKFKLIEISLNSGNAFGVSQPFSLLRSNYILQLNKPYEELYKAYRDNHKRNINKAFQANAKVSKEVSVDEIIRLNKEQLQHIDSTKSEDYTNFKRLYELLTSKAQAKTYAIVEKNKIVASAVFFFSHNRAYYIMPGNHPDGKTIGASHALIDGFIKDHSNQDLVLDFEGSDIRNLAFFYSGFGATEERYPALRINRLPWYARLLKK